MSGKLFDSVGLMVDCSNNGVMTLDAWRKFIPMVAKMGYDRIFVYTEDTYEVSGEEMFGYMRGRYSIDEQRELVRLGNEHGVDMVPCIQTLGHLGQIFKWGVYPNDTDTTLLVGDERAYTLIENMFKTLSGIYTSKYIHIGMDEAHNLGRCKYLDKNGYEDQSSIMRKHLDRVKLLAEKYGFTSMIWSDMLFRGWNGGSYYTGKTEVPKEYREALPEGVIPVYWDYYMKTSERYDDMLYNHLQISKDTWFAGGIWTWLGFAPSNRFTVASSLPAIETCLKRGIRNVFFTFWGDDGSECSRFAALAGLYHVAEMCKGNFDTGSIKAGFESEFGVSYDDFITLDEPNNVEFDDTAEYPTSSAAKHLLYSDPLLGFLDFAVTPGISEKYAEISERLLSIAEQDFEYAYIFRTLGILSKILICKSELGLKLRTAYRRGDRDGMQALLDGDITEIERLLPEFISLYRDLWLRENKYCGFEIQEARLGGLLERIRGVRIVISKYLSGETDRIEELENEVIPFGKISAGKPVFYNRYFRIFSPNISNY